MGSSRCELSVPIDGDTMDPLAVRGVSAHCYVRSMDRSEARKHYAQAFGTSPGECFRMVSSSVPGARGAPHRCQLPGCQAERLQRQHGTDSPCRSVSRPCRRPGVVGASQGVDRSQSIRGYGSGREESHADPCSASDHCVRLRLGIGTGCSKSQSRTNRLPDVRRREHRRRNDGNVRNAVRPAVPANVERRDRLQ